MDGAIEYVLNRKNIIEADKGDIEDRIQRLRYELGEVTEKMNEINDCVDTTFAVFSPHSASLSSELSQIDELSVKKQSIENEIIDLNNELEKVNCELNSINRVIIDEHEEGYDVNELSNEEPDLYGVKILEQQELERQRIARELHDSPVQVLTNLVHKCEICSKLIDKDTVRAKLELEVMSKSLRSTVDEMRKIIFDLRPMSFDDLGLDVTINHVISGINKEGSLKINFKTIGEVVDLPMVISLTFIRIIQESLNNCIKHSKADEVNVELEYCPNTIHLRINDNGIGFDNRSLKKKKDNTGFGLSMMKERVYLLAGDISINSEIGNGTTIDVVVPVS